MSERKQGYILVIISSILYSTLGILGKHTYSTGLAMSQVIVLRYFATLVVLGVFLLVTQKEPFFTRSLPVLFQGVFYIATAVFYFMAIKYLSAGLATVILLAYPSLVAVMAALFYREKINNRQVIGLGLALLGLFFISGLLTDKGLVISSFGLVYAILSCIALAFYSLLGQKSVKKDGVLTITFTVSLIGAILLVFLFPDDIIGLIFITPYQAFLGFLMALSGTILPVVLFLQAVKKIGASMASLINISEIPFSIILAYILLHETIYPAQILGTILIILATAIAITVKKA